jgi:hypothetical protein
MGLMHGHFKEDFETIIDETSPDIGIKAGVNVGIAIVTPSSKIMDIINGEELTRLLADYEASEMDKNSKTTPD